MDFGGQRRTRPRLQLFVSVSESRASTERRRCAALSLCSPPKRKLQLRLLPRLVRTSGLGAWHDTTHTPSLVLTLLFFCTLFTSSSERRVRPVVLTTYTRFRFCIWPLWIWTGIFFWSLDPIVVSARANSNSLDTLRNNSSSKQGNTWQKLTFDRYLRFRHSKDDLLT